jgi:hypothetical protein
MYDVIKPLPGIPLAPRATLHEEGDAVDNIVSVMEFQRPRKPEAMKFFRPLVIFA